MTNRERIPVEIVVVDEHAIGIMMDTKFGKSFDPMAMIHHGSQYYRSGSSVFLGENNTVRPATLADGEKFRIHLEAYGIKE